MSRVEVPADPRMDDEFDRAFEQLTELVDLSDIDQMFPTRGNAVDTTSVVLWMLVYQRMNTDTTLAATVKQLLDARPSFLPDNKRVRERQLSTNSGGYSKARSRVPLESVRHFAEFVSDSMINAAPGFFDGRRVFLLDGTTIALAPEPKLQAAFPPATNQHGEGVWPIAQLVVAHYAAVISDNLVSQFRRQAAELIDEPPRRLSFKNVWRTYRRFLLGAMFTDSANWREKYRLALSYATMDKLPNRPGRSSKREAYTKTSKAHRFDKRSKPKQIQSQCH